MVGCLRQGTSWRAGGQAATDPVPRWVPMWQLPQQSHQCSEACGSYTREYLRSVGNTFQEGHGTITLSSLFLSRFRRQHS